MYIYKHTYRYVYNYVYVAVYIAILRAKNKICVRINRYVQQSVCRTKTTCSSCIKAHQYTIPLTVKSLAYEDLVFDEVNRLGEGTFGKCIQARLAHLNTCIKVLKMEQLMNQHLLLKQLYFLIAVMLTYHGYTA